MAELYGSRVTKDEALASIEVGDRIIDSILHAPVNPCTGESIGAGNREQRRADLLAGFVLKAMGTVGLRAIEEQASGSPLDEATEFWGSWETDPKFREHVSQSDAPDPEDFIARQLTDNRPELHPLEARWVGSQAHGSYFDRQLIEGE